MGVTHSLRSCPEVVPPICPPRKLLSRIDGDGDGKLVKEELVAWLKRMEDHSYRSEAEDLFVKEDTDNDGYITFEEFWKNSQDEGEEG